MIRRVPLSLVALATLALAACGKEESAAPAAPAAVPPQSVPADPSPPPPQAVGESCKKDCAGQVVAIQCAAGETPVCECGPAPTALCRAPANGSQ